MELSGRVALITGGKRIGQAVALALARGGADVGLTYRSSREDAERTAAGVRDLGRRAAPVEADLADPDACERFVERCASELGRVDVLINMASLYRRCPLTDLTVERWDEDLDVNLRSAYLCARAALPHLRRAGGGHVINVSDWIAASHRPAYADYVAYYVAKAGVIALTEVLALELAPDGILVNAIAPGPILAPPDSTPDEIAAVERATPLGRWGGEEEIASAVLGLIASDFITGETIRVDGGRHLK